MKTTTKTAALKRLNDLTVKSESNSYPISKNSRAYINTYYAITGESRIIRTCHTSGRGRYTSNLDYTNDVVRVLDKIGFEYEFSNDSPRGGKTGNLITIKTKIK